MKVGERRDRRGGASASSSTTSRAARCTSGRRPTSAPTCCCASTTARPGGSWCGGCSRSSTPDGPRPTRARDAWITVAFTYQGLKALGVPQDSLDSFAPEFRQGMAARAAELGDVGESSPGNWETAARHQRRPRRAGGAVARRRAAAGGRREGAPRPRGASRGRGDLASGLLPAPDRAHLLRLQGRDRPAGGRGQRHSPVEPAGGAAQGRRDHPRLPRRDGRAAADADPGGARAETAPTSSSASCTPGWRRTGSTCARRPRAARRRRCSAPRWSGAGRAARRWRSSPDARRSRARRRPAPQQRLPLRRRSARLQVPGRRARATRQPAGRARPRGQRQRPPPPHDPARHQLRPDAARGRPRGRRRRPRASSSSSPARTCKRQFEFVKTQWLNDGIFIGAPAEKDPLVGPNDGSGAFTIPQTPIRRRLQELPPFVVTRGGEYCFAPGLRALRWLAELETLNSPRPRRGRRDHELDKHRPLEGTRLRPAAADGDGARLARARRVRLRRPDRRHHPEPAARRQRDHDRDGRPADRDRRDDRGPPAVRVVILTGAGDRAFSVGSDLRQRKNMTKEDWLRQRQDFDRTLYTLRQLRKPIFAAVNGIAYGGGSRDRPEHRLHHRLRQRHLRPARGDDRPGGRRWLAGAAAPAAPAGQGAADADDRRPDHRPGGAPAGHGQRDPSPGRADGRGTPDRGEDRRATRRPRSRRSSEPCAWARASRSSRRSRS